MRPVTIAITAAVLTALAGHPAARQAAAPGVRLGELTWPDAERALTADTVVVIPLGAGAKEHGLHLRLDNDSTLVNYLTRRVTEASSVVVAPTLTYHFYPAFIEYPGSTTLNLETARAMTVEVVRSLARYGPRRFYVLNTGVSTIRPLLAAAEALAQDGVLLGYTDIGARAGEAAARVRQQEGGTHADELETSMMLYIDPSVVDMKRALKEFTPAASAGRLTRIRGGAGAYSPSGVWGDATLATAEKGRVIVEGVVASVLREIETIRRAPLPTLTSAMAPAGRAAPALRGLGAANRTSGCSAGDERGIRTVGGAYSLNWANNDALALSGMWSDEGDMVHPDGLVERGRETIKVNRIAMFLRKEYRGSLHPLMIGNVRCLSGDIAVADAKWELRNVSDTGGKVLPPFEGQATLVLKRAGAAWLIEAYRYTIKPTPVPPPTWLKRPGFPG